MGICSTGPLAGAGRIELVHDALCAEAMACLYALRAAANNGISHVSVETDCSVLVQALKSADYDQATAGVIFKQIRLMSLVDFVKVDVSFADRSCNRVVLMNWLVEGLIGTRVRCPFGLTPSRVL